GGFFGKFYVFAAAIHSGMIWLAIIGLINSGIAAFYYLRVAAAVFSRPAQASAVMAVPRPSVALLFALFITAAATLILGIAPGGVLAGARAAAATYPSVNPPAATAPVEAATR
ncbi:MAG TPA: hypothetical protein VJS11_01780, partial [Acidobacteriaceae bacterium]|nr:hypothetical protein [Acidobacteriaceae bacterium]